MAEMQARDWTEELLVGAAATVHYPPTPDIAGTVRARLAALDEGRAVAPRRPWLAPVAAGVAAFVVAAVVALAVSSGARDAVAEFLGLRVEGEEITIVPTPRPSETPTAPPPPTRDIASYATPVALADIEAIVGFLPVLPAGYGNPEGTYVVDFELTKAAVFQYEEFDLWEVRLRTGDSSAYPFFTKDTRVLEELSVHGRPAYWIEGGGHIVRFVDGNGTVVAGSERTVERNTLVWRSTSGTNYRLETTLSKEEAVAIAETLP